MVINKIRRTAVTAACLALLLQVSGCMYPKDQTPGNDVTARAVVRTIQAAVDSYQADTGLLPIQNADATVPRYEKYRLDLAKMKRMGYVSSIPDIAFENGGSFIFLVIDEETKPQVKLLDITVHQGIAGVQRQVDEYRQDHNGAIPAGDEANPGFYYLDFGKLGIKQPDLKSMYSGHPLELLVDEAGKVYADYRLDIAAALEKTKSTPQAGEDLRRRLVEVSDYVPVNAPVYHGGKEGPAAAAEPAL